MDYKNAIEKINSLNKYGMKLGLERMEKLLKLLFNPQDKIRFIHVAGTNGKGSICNMVASILKDSGYKTGLFISPYVIDFRERIQINNKMISEQEVINLVEKIMPIAEEMSLHGDAVTEFEFITAMAFKYFYDTKCDIVVLEVGLGGRYDSTNVIKNPLLSVITSISYDHENILGDTLGKIAFEKCGIIKEGIDTIMYQSQEKEVIATVKKVCNDKNSKLILSKDPSIEVLNAGIDYTHIEYKQIQIKIPFAGIHQVKNVSVVLSIIENLKEKGFNIQSSNIKNGIENAKFPARIEILNKEPLIILDGSHNPSGIKALSEFIKSFVKKKKIIGIVGMLKDKDVNSSLLSIEGIFSKVIAVTVNNDRAMQSTDLKNILINYCTDVHSINSINDALNYVRRLLDSDTAVIIFGSLYLASCARDLIAKNFKTK